MKELPLFPLNLVAFPGEDVNLHVFEPRYKQLVNDCLESSTTFGIPSYVLNKIELGTEVEIVEVTTTYDDGRMDIKTKALQVFRVNEYWNPWEEKLYAGGQIEYLPKVEEKINQSLLLKFKELVSQLFAWLRDVDTPSIAEIKSTFDIAHKIGLKPEEEYLLLKSNGENERLDYVISHLERLLPALERAHSAQERIKQNGHFKNLDPLKF